MSLDSTIDRIKKLLAKAQDASVTAAEAAAFASKANELLLKHKLEMSDIEIQAEDVIDPIESGWYDLSAQVGYGVRGRQTWLTMLLDSIAKAHFVVPLHDPDKSKRVFLVGRKSDKEIATYLMVTLGQNGRRLAFELWPTASGRRKDVMQARASFLLGYVVEIRRRLREMKEQVTAQGGQFALTRFNQVEKDVLNAAREYSGDKRGSANPAIRDERAYETGKEAGASVSLIGGLGGGSASRGTLASGQALLGAGR